MFHTDNPTHVTTRRPRRPRRRGIGALAAACTAAAVVVPTASIVAASSDGAATTAGAPQRVEVLDLGCEAQTSPGGAGAGAVDGVVYGVSCRWSVPTADQAAGVRLRRVIVDSGAPRETVFRSDDVGDNQHLDTPVRPDRRYAYRVQALNDAGRVVASSRTVVVGVPSVDVETLRLDCRVGDGEPQAGATRVHVGCVWTSPTSASVLTLWRSVDGGPREQVASFTRPFPTSYRDVVPASAERVVYAVVGTDGDGVVVARSRPEPVRIPEVGVTVGDPIAEPTR